MKDRCRHKSLRATVLFLEPNALSYCRLAVVSACCQQCGQAFEFSNLNTLNDDKTQIRLLITEAQPENIKRNGAAGVITMRSRCGWGWSYYFRANQKKTTSGKLSVSAALDGCAPRLPPGGMTVKVWTFSTPRRTPTRAWLLTQPGGPWPL